MRERIEIVQRATEEGRLVEPESLVEDLMLSEASDYEQRQALLRQVGIAQDREEGEWLSDVAGFSYRGGFAWCSEGWIERHIGDIPRWARTHTGRPPHRESTRGGACGHASDEVASTSRASEEGWTLVRSPKRARRFSPIRWDEVKITYDAGCFKCGERGHWSQECRNEWLCHRCLGHGHIAKYCPEKHSTSRLTAASTSRGSTSEVPRAPSDKAQVEAPEQKMAAASTSRSSSSSVERLVIEVGTTRSVFASTSRSDARSESGPGDRPQREDSAPRTAVASTSRSSLSSVPVEGRVGAQKRNVEGVPRPAGAQGKWPKFKACPIPWCKWNFHYRKGHVFGCHYPTALCKDDARSSPEEAMTLVRIMALRNIALILLGSNANLDDLITYLNNHGCLEGREECQVDEWTRKVATEVAEELELPVPDRFTCNPINSPGVIFQYRVMLTVLGLMSEQEHRDFLVRFSAEQWPEPNPVVVEVDEEGRREVHTKEVVKEAEASSTSAGMEVRQEAEASSTSAGMGVDLEDRISSTSAGSRPEVIAVPSCSESSVSSPRRPWRPEYNPEVELHLSDMEVLDEVGEEEPEQEPDRKFVPVANFRFESVDSHFHLDRLCKRVGIKPFNYQEAIAKVKPDSGNTEVDGAVAVWCDPQTYPTKRQVASLLKSRVVSVIGIHPGKVIEGDVPKLAKILDTYDVVGLGEVGLDGTKEDPELQRRTLDEVLILLKKRPHLVLVLHCRPGPKDNISGAYFELFYRCKGILSPNQRIHLHCFNGTMEDVSLWLGYFPNTYFGYSLMVTRNYFDGDSKLALKRISAECLLLETDAPYFPYNREDSSSPAYIHVTAQEVARIRGCSSGELLRQTACNAQRLYWG